MKNISHDIAKEFERNVQILLPLTINKFVEEEEIPKEEMKIIKNLKLISE